jgi:hypothetical protein
LCALTIRATGMSATSSTSSHHRSIDTSMKHDRDRVRPVEGDIIVTAVGEHYAIGRLKADGDTQEYLQSQRNRAVALRQACVQAGAKHRVFMYPTAGTPNYLPVDCAEVIKARTTGGKR